MFACVTDSDACMVDSDCELGMMCMLDTDLVRRCMAPGCGGIGRPFIVSSEARVADGVARTDWAAACPLPAVDGLDAALCRALGRAWTETALAEHASIAAFARVSLQLLALGAPAELVERAHAAMADETRHARLCFALASAYSGAPVGPGELDVSHALAETELGQIVVTAIVEGCIGETLAAAEAAEGARQATDPVVANLLSRIAEDEASHAELAWRFVAWAIDSAPAETRRRIATELELVARAPLQVAGEEPSDALEPHGFVVGSQRRRLRAQVHAEVIARCAEALIARARHSESRGTDWHCVAQAVPPSLGR
jgi:hypothetical protein